MPSSNFDLFRESISGFSAEDYLTERPYQHLREFTHDNVIRYIQFLNILLLEAEKLHVDLDEARKMSNQIQLELKCTWAHNFLYRIVHESRKTDTDGRIRVLPLMCGTGKSSAISHIMSECISDHLFFQAPENAPYLADPNISNLSNNYGLLVVTDNIDRMNGYLEPSKQSYAAKALIDHPELVTIMERRTLSQAMENYRHTPVLVMTTQRYFRLTQEEIENFLCWEHGKRGLVIFDEQPLLLEFIEISPYTLHKAAGELALSARGSSALDERDWCVDQWDAVCRKLEEVLRTLERRPWQTDNKHPNAHCYFTFPDGQAYTEDEERFMRYVDLHKAYLSNCYSTYLAVQQLMHNGAIYTCTKMNSRYENAFGIVLDHRHKVTDIPADVIVFDGTGDITPEYQNEHFIIDEALGIDFRRDTSNVEITFIDHNTSKRYLQEDHRHYTHSAIIDFLRQRWQGEKGAIFTYQSEEGYFRKIVDERNLSGQMLLNHFGNTRGSNTYRELKHIAQVGLFNRTPFNYLCLSLHLDSASMNYFKSLPPDDANCWLNDYVDSSPVHQKHRYAYLMADIEQNLFRGAIRNPEFTGQFSYQIFCSHAECIELSHCLKDRYPEMSIECLLPPIELQLVKIRTRLTEKPTKAQKILERYDALPSGTIFTSDSLLEGTGIDQKRFKDTKKDNPTLASFFASIRIGSSKKYRKP